MTEGSNCSACLGLSCGQSLQEQGHTKILAVVRLSGLCGNVHFSMFRTLQPGFEAATTSRRQKCPPVAPGGPAGESRALCPAPPRAAGPAAPAGAQLGREGDKRGPGVAPRPQLGGHDSPMVPRAGPGGPVPMLARTAMLRTDPPACL